MKTLLIDFGDSSVMQLNTYRYIYIYGCRPDVFCIHKFMKLFKHKVVEDRQYLCGGNLV